ncbi:S8 family serine peptidase [Francisella sciaenopsi]|uniref:Peptidase S8/S53 domain-containing protein n=1 Tax=Francisella sciaenopsi TaxID=3055034 RepID=A0ABQ6PE85_9GAMM
MFKKIFLIGASLYASAYANDIELIVKYKDNQNKNGAVFSANAVGTSQAQNYQVLEEIDSRTKIVKVSDGQPLQPTTTSLKTQSSSAAQRVSNSDTYAAAKSFMDNSPNVEYAIPKNSKMYAYDLNNTQATNTTDFQNNIISWGQQWDMHSPKEVTGGIDAYGAWDLVLDNSKRVDVAVIDSGLAYAAPEDISKKIDRDYKHYYFFMKNRELRISSNIYDNGSFHGTHVAGTVAANGPKVKGVAGPIDSIKILPIRALGDDGSGDTYAILESVKWAAGAQVYAKNSSGQYLENNKAPVKVINLSLGMSRIDPYTGQPIVSQDEWRDNYMGTLCPAWKEAIQTAHQRGVTVVIAAGNDGKNLFNDIPSGCRDINAIVVESTGPKGLLAPYSTYYAPDGILKWRVNSLVVRAPGGDSYNYGKTAQIYSTLNNYEYGYMQGTSMATPHVAGIIALLYANLQESQFPEHDISTVRKALEDSKDIYSPNIVNAKNSLKNLGNTGQKQAA